MCEFLKDLFVSLVGAAVCIGGSFYIFYKTIQDNRMSDKTKEETQLKNRIRFLANLITEVIAQTNKQISLYEDQGKAIIYNPYKLHFPSILANNQMERLKDVDSQGIFEGYYLLFGQKEQTLKDYNLLLNQIDFLDKRMRQLHEANEGNIKNLANDLEIMRIAVDDLYSRFHILLPLVGDVRYSQLMIKFNEYIGTGEVDVKSLQNDFMVLLFKEVRALSPSEGNEEAQAQLIILIRNVTSRIEHIKVNNENYAKSDPLIISDQLKECLEKLNEILEKINSKL